MTTHPFVASPYKSVCSSCGKKRSSQIHQWDNEACPVPLQQPRFFIHTTKAVRRGHFNNRLFLVVATLEDGLLAWKVEITKEGLWHPAFKTLLPFTPAGLMQGFIQRGSNGSEPTAWFKPDSFYKEVGLPDIVRRAE